MNTPTTTTNPPNSADAGEDASAHPLPSHCPPFSFKVFSRQMRIDGAVRWALFALLAVTLGFAIAQDSSTSPVVMPLMIALGALWMWLSVNSAKVTRELGMIASAMDRDPAAAESRIAQVVRPWPIQRSLRLTLYYCLAILRYRQQRFGETAAICQALLAYNPPFAGPAGPLRANLKLQGASVQSTRTQLLLMLADSQLRTADLWGAYNTLMLLHQSRLNLFEALQKTELQTRYEVWTGHDRWALNQLEQKLSMSELMPYPQCLAMHTLLGIAAQRCGEKNLAHWLHRRSEVLGALAPKAAATAQL